MTERTKEIWKLAAPIIFVFTLIPIAIYHIATLDKDLVDYDKREQIYVAFENEMKSIEIPEKFTIKNFEKGGKSGSSLTGTTTYRTRLQMAETIKQVHTEFNRLGWKFWKSEKNTFIYCKGKFEGKVVYSMYREEKSTDIFLNFSVKSGSGTFFGDQRPKECRN